MVPTATDPKAVRRDREETERSLTEHLHEAVGLSRCGQERDASLSASARRFCSPHLLASVRHRLGYEPGGSEGEAVGGIKQRIIGPGSPAARCWSVLVRTAGLCRGALSRRLFFLLSPLSFGEGHNAACTMLTPLPPPPSPSSPLSLPPPVHLCVLRKEFRKA
jgi:hypothetical protein